MRSDPYSHPFLSEFEVSGDAVLAEGAFRELAAGDILRRPGDVAQTFYLVDEGELEAFAGGDGDEVPVWAFNAGDSVGEHDLLQGDDRVCALGLRCRTPSIVFEIPASAFDEHLAPKMRARQTQRAVAQPKQSLEVLRRHVLTTAADGCRLLSFQEGEHVVLEGDLGDAAYFIVHGEAQAIRGDKTLTTMTTGQVFGELAVLDGEPRSATVTAATRLVVLRVEAEVFSRWVIGYEPLRALVAMQRQIYRGPNGKSVTVVTKGTYRGEPSLTSIVSYGDGGKYSATKLSERDVMIWTELSEPTPIKSVVAFEKAGLSRRLHLAEDRRVVKIEAQGNLEGVDSLCARLIAKTPLKPALEARFRWSGKLEKPKQGALLCACVGLTMSDAQSIEPCQLRAVTGAGSICGSCDRRLRELEPKPEERVASVVERGFPPEREKSKNFTGMPYRQFVEKVIQKEVELPKAAKIAAHLETEHPELFEPDNRTTSRATLSLFLRLGVAFVGMVVCVQQGFFIPAILLAIFQAFNYYGASALVHDFAHDAGFSKLGFNRLFGTLLSLPLLSRFSSFRESHLQHHRVNQSLEDPKVSPPALDERRNSLLWKVLFLTHDHVYMKIPNLIKNIWLASWLLMFTAPMVMLRYEFSAFRKIRNRNDVIDTLAVAVFWVGAFLLLGWPAAVMALVVPLFAGYALIGVVFMTHASEYTINSEENRPDEYELMIFNINNLTMGKLVDRIGYFFHRFHVEHHLFPTLPFHRLEAASKFLEREYGQFMLPTRTLNFEYINRGFMDHSRHIGPVQLAGRTFFAGSLFDQIQFGRAQEVPKVR